jgi:hypothetical protein
MMLDQNEYRPEMGEAHHSHRPIAITAAEHRSEAAEPILDRLRRAYLNGYRDGAMRGSLGRWDD